MANLDVLQLLRTVVDTSTSATFTVPYQKANTGSVHDEALLVERQAYPRVGVGTAFETGHVNKRGVMFDVSDEALHFTRNGQINFEAWAETIAAGTRAVRERVHAMAANAMLRASDELGAIPVTGEAVNAGSYGVATGNEAMIKLQHFPVVQPYQAVDLQGAAIGTPRNIITLTLGGNAIPMWAGEDAGQSAGTYYRVLDYNRGLLMLVTETGAPVTSQPTGTISYSRTENVARFDLDTPADTKDADHLNAAIQSIGRRKARMAQDYYLSPDFLLMAHTVDDTLSNASQFMQSLRVDGSDTDAAGRVERLKNLPKYNIAAPGVVLGESRILLGVRQSTTMHVAKPWAFSQPRPADVTVGDRVAYSGAQIAHGDEFSGLHTPQEYRKRYTSVLVHSSSERDAL
ncbi:MAG: hypothetical protein AAF499_14615 [Pseudomonadota bacterium]